MLAGGGNQSGKTFIGMVKLASVSCGWHGEVMCPRDCPQWGVGSCGIHGCPGPDNGGSLSRPWTTKGGRVVECSYGRPVACEKHKPLEMPKPRKLAVVGQDLEKLYELIYKETLRPLLPKTIGNKLRFTEPRRTANDHHIKALDGSWDIEMISQKSGSGKQAVQSLRKLLMVIDELPSHDMYREARPRMWAYNGQILIVATHDNLLDENPEGMWIYPELVSVSSPRVQVISLDTTRNFAVDQETIAEDAELMSDEEREIRIHGGFGFRSGRCIFDTFTLERQQSFAKDPEPAVLTGCEPPRHGAADLVAYYNGTTRFPEKCLLEPLDRQILIKERKDTGHGGVACSDCVKRCVFYRPPPETKSALSAVSPRIEYGRNHRGLDISIWSPPVHGRIYIAGTDVATGRKGGDYSVTDIYDAMTGEEVALLYGRWKEREFAYATWGMINLYNDALWVPECNGPGAIVIHVVMHELGYTNVYTDHSRMIKLASGASIPQVGYEANKATKRDMLFKHFIPMLEEAKMTIKNRHLSESEMPNFVRDRGSVGAVKGAHDDCVIAAALVSLGWDHVDRSVFTDPDGLIDVSYPRDSAAAVDKAWEDRERKKKMNKGSFRC